MRALYLRRPLDDGPGVPGYVLGDVPEEGFPDVHRLPHVEVVKGRTRVVHVVLLVQDVERADYGGKRKLTFEDETFALEMARNGGASSSNNEKGAATTTTVCEAAAAAAATTTTARSAATQEAKTNSKVAYEAEMIF